MLTFKQIQDQAIRRFSSALRPDLKEWIQLAYDTVWNAEQWTFRYSAVPVSVTSGSADLGGLPGDLGVPISLQRADGSPLAPMGLREYYRRYFGSQVSNGLPEAFAVLAGGIKVGPPSNETSSLYELVHERALAHYPSTTMSAIATLPTATLTVVDTSEFPSAGQAWVAGRLVTYTGKTATTLTGCTGGAGAIAVGALVVSTAAVAGTLNADTDVPVLPAGTHMILVYGAQSAGQTLEADSTALLSDARVDRILAGMRRSYLVDQRAGKKQWGRRRRVG